LSFTSLKNIHIIGIGGCASSAIAELLLDNNVGVSGAEMKQRSGLEYLIQKGAKIVFFHDKNNLYLNGVKPDIVLFSPAVTSLDPNNAELNEAKENNVPLISWQNFIGDYLNEFGKTGITVSGSEGKGTTAGILTMILKDTKFDPLSILGAKLKNIYPNSSSNIYTGNGSTYILEGDEYNRNFLNYHPAINVLVNFEYEHPETYKNFQEYKDAFYQFFCGMKNQKTLILRASKNIIDFVKEYSIDKTHKIIWFGKNEELSNVNDKNQKFLIKEHKLTDGGNVFTLETDSKNYSFKIPALPGYICYNATGAILAAFELGLTYHEIKENILRFTGMVRRFDLYKTQKDGYFITDYGHSPESLNHIIKEIRSIFPDKKLHIIFQPHLFSRTYNFYKEFIKALEKADRISLIDIYPAREKEADWKEKISSLKLYEELVKTKDDVFYAGKSSDIHKSLADKINPDEISCFIGAGDMDLYFNSLFEQFNVKNY